MRVIDQEGRVWSRVENTRRIYDVCPPDPEFPVQCAWAPGAAVKSRPTRLDQRPDTHRDRCERCSWLDRFRQISGAREPCTNLHGIARRKLQGGARRARGYTPPGSAARPGIDMALFPGVGTLASWRSCPSTAVAVAGTVCGAMTAKERLRERVERLSEQEAGEALRLLDQRPDPVVAVFRDAPIDDEPWTEQDEAAAAEGRADIAAGRIVSLEDAMRDLE